MSREADMRERQEDDAVVDALSSAAREIAAGDAGPGPTPAVWHRLQHRLHAGRTRTARPPWRGLLLAGAGVAAAFALVMVARGVQRTRPISYVVEQGAAEQDGYIRGAGDGQSQVRFSDGTHVDLEHGARVSVLSRGPRGARLRVEEGRAHFDVAHLPHAAWSVEAGPYVVYVTGTVFDVRWSGSDEVIEVRMRAGSVQVGGPLLPERVTLRAGQHLTAKLASGELHIDEGKVGIGAGAAESAPARAPAAAPSAAVETGAPPAPEPAVAPAAPVLPPAPPLPASGPAPAAAASPPIAQAEPAPPPEAPAAAAPAP
ncbi:MAG TPA: FecR family protein, partial [Polyangia bacterium]